MQELLKWLASLGGMEVEEGATLQLELASFPSGGLALLILVAMVAVCFVVVAIYRRDAHRLSRGRRISLASLRILALLAVSLVALEPTLVTVKEEKHPGHSILLLDTSQSMGHRDAFRHQDVQEIRESWRSILGTDPAGVSRIDLAKALLQHGDAEVIRKLAASNNLLVYGFGSGVEPLPMKDDGTALDTEAIVADGRFSNLGGALRAALEKSRDANIAALILLSDGRRNVGSKGSEMARFMSQRKVDQILILGVGDPSEAQTVEVTRMEAPEKAFQKDPFKIKASVASQGYDEMSLTLRLLQIPADGGEGRVVQTKSVQVGGEQQEADVEFENLTSQHAGLFTYKVEVEPPSGEPASPDRHSKQARVELLDQQTRVLLVSGGPMYEYQILRNLLVRDGTIKVSCWLISADEDFPQDGNVVLTELPKDQKELDPFDVFIFMDPDPEGLSRDLCELVAKQVQDHGAGLWWVCGEKFALNALRQGASTEPLVELLPVLPDMEKAALMIGYGRSFQRPFPYEMTPEGESHALLRLSDASKDANSLLWGRLPGWHFAFPILKAKPVAKVLVDSDAASFRAATGPLPIIATQLVGAGRVLFNGTDETYRWRSLYEDEYNRFWVKGIRHLFEGRLNAGNLRLRLDLSASKLELGEPLKIVVEAKDEAYQPLVADSYQLEVRREGSDPHNLELAAVAGMAGQFTATYRPAKTGFFQFSPVDKSGRSVESTVQVVAASVEKEGPVNLGELGAIAAARNGQLLRSPKDLLQSLDSIVSRTTTETFRIPRALWDHWFTVAVILSLLAAEWWLRKRWNLL